MTVAELRNLLSTFNDDDVVTMDGGESGWYRVATLEINGEVVWHTADGETV